MRLSGFQVGGIHGESANPLAGSGKDRIGHGGRHQRNGCFTNAAGRVGTGDDVHVDLGHLIHAKQWKIVKIGLFHPTLANRDTALQGGCEAESDSPFHLCRNDIGVDDDFIKEVGNKIEPGHSALFLLIRKATKDKLAEELKQFKATVLQTSLSEEDDEKLRAIFGAEDVEA